MESSSREQFERHFPCPEQVRWDQARARYVSECQYDPGPVRDAITQNKMLEVWLTARAEFDLPLSQEPKYTVRPGALINRASGKAIPADEPVFVFRGSDKYSVTALCHYAKLIEGEHRQVVLRRIDDFERFQAAHPDRVKQPDTTTPPSEGPSP